MTEGESITETTTTETTTETTTIVITETTPETTPETAPETTTDNPENIPKKRKRRLNIIEIMDYINWSKDRDELIKNSSYINIQRAYKEQTGKDVSLTFIRNQKLRALKEQK